MTPELALQNIGLYSLQIAILTIVAALLPWAFGLRVPRAQLAFWYAVLAACLLLPFVQPWHQLPVDTAGKVSVTSVGFILDRGRGNDDRLFSWGLGWAGTALLLLAFGTAVRLGLLALGLMKLRRLRRHAEPVPQAPSLDRAFNLTGVTAEFLRSDDVAGPVTFGVERPVVLVPAGFFDLEPVEQESIAIHELLHVRRRDWLYTLAEEGVRAILWFHPAIWFLLNRVQLAREQSVDEAVVNCTRRVQEYVGALLKIAATRIEPDLAPAPLFLKKRHLRERVAAIVTGANMSKSRLTLTMIAVLTVLPLVAGMLAWQIPLQAAPQEVRDSSGVEIRTGPFKVLHRDAVDYPVEARKKGLSGDVVVSVSVNNLGEVTDAQVVSGPEELRKAVLRSVLGWHFANDARSLPSSFEVGVRFTSGAASHAFPEPAGPPPQAIGKTLMVERIDTSLLPQALREKVEQAMPVRTGEVIGFDRFGDIERALQGIDGHLRLRGSINNEKTVLHVSLAGLDTAAFKGTMTPSPSRLRIGGDKQAMNLLTKVNPPYPPLAKQSRIQGSVRLEALIAKDGHVANLELVTGHPLLVPPSMDAVRQWIYKPTLLNGEPVEVITQIDVNFTLSP
jgi:TonB family protein